MFYTSSELLTHLQVIIHAEREPVGEHLLDDGLGAPEHQLRVFGCYAPVDEPEQQQPQHLRQVLHATGQDHHQQRRHVHSSQ